MISYFQLFEFSYPDGFLFFDRSGEVARRLSTEFPNLQPKPPSLQQRDFISQDIELFYGTARSLIQMYGLAAATFPQVAAKFLELVTSVLEIGLLSEFRFRHVLARACNTDEEARDLMWPIMPEEQKAKMLAVAPLAEWRAVQGEFVHGNLAFESRVAVMQLNPQEDPSSQDPFGGPVPHITSHLDVRGQTPISVAEFDPGAFITNMRSKHTEEILSKLAPHLS